MSIFLTVVIFHLFAVVSPGPDFILVTRQAFRYGRKVAIWTSLGISIGILFHVSLSITGLSILLQSQPTLIWYLKIIASLYIAYLGLVSLFSKETNFVKEGLEDNSSGNFYEELLNLTPIQCNDGTLVSEKSNTISDLKTYLPFVKPRVDNSSDLISDPSNVHFNTLLAAELIVNKNNLVIKILLGVYMSVATFIWFVCVSLFLTHKVAMNLFHSAVPWIERITGILLLGISIQIILQQL